MNEQVLAAVCIVLAETLRKGTGSFFMPFTPEEYEAAIQVVRKAFVA